jgi:integrase
VQCVPGFRAREGRMARPWPKKSKWPYVAKSGRRSYVVGFYDHDRRERCRTFPSVRHARAWMDDYISAERRGRESLRRLLLDLDAKEANELEARTIGQLLELYLQVNAHPSNPGGLAPATYERYESLIGLHMLDKPRRRGFGMVPPRPYAVVFCSIPAVRFNEPQAPAGWREQMLREGVPKATRKHAWRVLSAALSWAASSNLVGEIRTNGCSFAPEPRGNIRRSLRSGGTGYEPGPRRHGPLVPAWALSPTAVEAIRAQMLARIEGRKAILARRDAMIVSLQYGLCARNQEVWGLRWSSLKGDFAWVLEVLSNGRLDEWGKTEHSTQRRTTIPSLLQEDLAEWRSALQAIGHPARELDFIIPGDLAGPTHGERDPRTGACHFSENQASGWGQRFFTPAVEKAALQSELFAILGATPYSLRRGGISLRLRTEDPQTVASECGTSLRTLSKHYAYVIEDLHRNGPRPADTEWRAARAEQAEHQALGNPPSLRAASEAAHSRGKIRNWLDAHRRRTQRA